MHSRFLIMVCECGLGKPCRKISLRSRPAYLIARDEAVASGERQFQRLLKTLLMTHPWLDQALGVRCNNDRLSGSIAPGSVLLKRTDAFGRARIRSFQTIDRTAYLRRGLAQIANDHKS